MKKILILFVLLFMVVGMSFAQSAPSDAQIRKSANELGVPYESLKEFLDSFFNNNQFIGIFYSERYNQSLDLRVNSDAVLSWSSGRALGKFSIRNNVIEIVFPSGSMNTFTIIDNDTLIRDDMNLRFTKR
jgi:hypothetical protein